MNIRAFFVSRSQLLPLNQPSERTLPGIGTRRVRRRLAFALGNQLPLTPSCEAIHGRRQ